LQLKPASDIVAKVLPRQLSYMITKFKKISCIKRGFSFALCDEEGVATGSTAAGSLE
jgi:hypothetical protein